MIRPHDSIIVQALGYFIIPMVQIFGLYVLFFGQNPFELPLNSNDWVNAWGSAMFRFCFASQTLPCAP